MSISNALSNAGSGLRANSKLIDTISNNVANELTPGYAKRVTELTSTTVNGYGSGVGTLATTRVEDALLTSERRLSDAAAGTATVTSSAYSAILASLGEPGEAGALSTLVTDFEGALMAAAASPQSQALLQDVFTAAQSMTEALNRISQDNKQARQTADAEIGRQVTQLNTALHQVDELNDKIVTMNAQGIDTLGLQDQRASIIDSISGIVPIRVVNRENGQLALYTQNGGLLLDGQVFELGFTPAGDVITPDMTIGDGLSALSQNQNAAGGPVTLNTTSPNGPIAGGSLAALFAVRDSTVPQFDREMDMFAAEMIDRFQSLMPAAALDGSGNGLLVDPTGAATTTGLAGRIAINAAADPDQGGALFRIRDGLGAATAGESGFGDYLQGMADAMGATRAPAGWTTQVAAADAATMAADIASFFATHANNTESDRAYQVARQSTLIEQETNKTGVDGDSEMQTLIVVEQAYAANAKVISVIDELLQTLLEI